MHRRGYTTRMAELASGTLLAGHRIEGVAGRGGMGVVYHATHLALERTVALKVIAPSAGRRQRGAPAFPARIEARRLARSPERHPGLLHGRGGRRRLHRDALRPGPGPALARARGGPARAGARRTDHRPDRGRSRRRARRRAHPPRRQAGQHPAHGRDHVYLSDFGLTKHALSLDGATRSGHWVGTLDYVAPEQIRGDRVDARADVYALGCVLTFALTGVPPFQREGDEESCGRT